MTDIYTFEHQRRFVGKGWQPLIEELHARLTELVGDYQVMQIKEKFGGLRYYTSIPYDSEAGRLILAAEEKSQNICEDCGQPARVRSIGGWWRTLCDEHERKALADRAERMKQLGGNS